MYETGMEVWTFNQFKIQLIDCNAVEEASFVFTFKSKNAACRATIVSQPSKCLWGGLMNQFCPLYHHFDISLRPPLPSSCETSR